VSGYVLYIALSQLMAMEHPIWHSITLLGLELVSMNSRAMYSFGKNLTDFMSQPPIKILSI
jgi:hypothetical protein